MDWKSEESKRLIRAVLTLETEDEAKRFLRDLMTAKEIEEFSKRLKAAEMLTEKASYSSIGRETGLSSTTIARVNKWLKGSMGGYKLILERLKENR